MILSTIHWEIDILAQSSIVHREDYSNSVGTDTFALFRREKIISPAGDVLQVPIVSGSSFRGVLRRIGEDLTAAVLNYEGALPIPAAHLLTNGGRLAKSARPITDEGERQLKNLLPQVAVFGGAASGRIMSGLLTVGKVLPEISELAHLLPRPTQTPLLTILGTAEESFSHLADHRTAGDQPPTHDTNEISSPLGRFGVETLPAGTRLQTWVRLSNATDQQAAFLRDVLSTFADHGHLGGRIAAGHGRVTASTTATAIRGQLPSPDLDWTSQLANQRDAAIQALTALT
ncbi:CRISPR type AFERR-associated protein Csf2 [Mycobacteroides abscessus subsp. abscessus]|uniref:RAMP superfamily CRISPR-associated protein n=1 Tax=Mycobacteroides abscessus TaxID=36809 RepID=UPI000925BC0E|nr:RAMP superfamily CRISPR-associated protein [Mycobacteroides abscessus]SIJ22350.1 CRISPR type AFERR-associated protein Csf2 [Mycobacteroides abscessus subsp. abscessus]SLH38402.1 CRISPR type AFERR-associated protein Csf2 [Mycobacteroides abscessus subsp. abscessus]